jgi:hypothetical protein
MTNPFRSLRASRWRSIAGMAVAVLVLPFLLGSDSCYVLQTPIGDPDHAWADPRISGVWIAGEREALKKYSAELWFFEPYDDKSWLVTYSSFKDGEHTVTNSIDAGTSASTADTGPTPAPAAPAAPASSSEALDVPGIVKTLTEQRAEPGGVALFKGWAVSLGGRRFLVLEPRAIPSTNRGFLTEGWWVFAADLKEGRLVLSGVNSDIEKLYEAKTRAQAEAIIARHAADPKFTEPVSILDRVPKGAYDDAGKAMQRALAH